MLALAAAAVVAGMKGYTANRSREDACLPALVQVRLDGRAIRGAQDADGNQVRLLAAMVGPGAAMVGPGAAASVIAAQAEVGKKTNEVPMAKVVLAQVDLGNKVVTADALHTVKATSNYIHEHGASSYSRSRRIGGPDKGHGRITTRTIQVLPAPEGLPFPHVSQVFLIERYATDLHGRLVSAVAVLGVASPKPERADAAALASYVASTGPWGPAPNLRDTLYREDKSKVRTRSGPRAMAAHRELGRYCGQKAVEKPEGG